ncbi:MAG: restriction endonuclease subunit S [Planctomycetota bacterium]
MKPGTLASPRAFAVMFRDLHRWSVGAFVQTDWRWPADTIKPLSAVLSRKTVDVERASAQPGELRLVTLHFDGEMEPRDASAGDGFKGRLFHADPGDVIYSKIDVRNGAIGIIPDDLGRVCVSSEYPVYTVNSQLAEARYVKLLFRSAVFRRKINSMISGASGRKRVQPTDLVEVQVPFPTLPDQRKIVTAWETARKSAAATAAEIEGLERDIEARFLADLGLKAPTQSSMPRAFALLWSEIHRWGVTIAWRERQVIGKSKYPMATISEVCQTGSGGTPSRKRREFFGGGIPWVKTTEVRGEVITTTEETLSSAGLENSSAHLYPAGSIVIAMYGQGATRGRSAKLGIEAATNQACLILHDFDARVEPDFVWSYLTGEYNRLRELGSGNNQPNLSAELIRGYPIVIPPLAVQRQIVERVAKRREEIARLKADAKTCADAAKAAVEGMILGTKPIE